MERALKPEAAPLLGEPVLTNNVNSAFISTELQELLLCSFMFNEESLPLPPLRVSVSYQETEPL
jgi:hypothetical protein